MHAMNCREPQLIRSYLRAIAAQQWRENGAQLFQLHLSGILWPEDLQGSQGDTEDHLQGARDWKHQQVAVVRRSYGATPWSVLRHVVRWWRLYRDPVVRRSDARSISNGVPPATTPGPCQTVPNGRSLRRALIKRYGQRQKLARRQPWWGLPRPLPVRLGLKGARRASQ